MTYNDTFIKGVTYGEAEELWDVARTAGFIAFLEEFKKLADTYAQERLEGFIDDHFPEDKLPTPKANVNIFDFLTSDAVKPMTTQQYVDLMKSTKFVHPID